MIHKKVLALSFAAAAVTLTSAFASAAAKIDIRCDTLAGAAKKTSIQFGISRYTYDVWPDSVAYGANLENRVQEIDVGQFMNDDKSIFLKLYIPENLPADADLAGLKLRLKGGAAGKWTGTLSEYTVSYGPRREKESNSLPVECKAK